MVAIENLKTYCLMSDGDGDFLCLVSSWDNFGIMEEYGQPVPPAGTICTVQLRARVYHLKGGYCLLAVLLRVYLLC
jgi:hypothetical protein